MKRPLSTRERRLLSVATLAVLTLAGRVAVACIERLPRPAGAPVRAAAPPPVVAVPAEGGPVSLSARLDRGAVLAGAPGEVRLEVTLAADRRADGHRKPTDFYVVFDRSGSMEGDKIAHARTAVRQLIGQLAADDRFALVSYASEARVDVSLAPAVAGQDPELGPHRWLDAVASLEAGGGTAMSLGLDLALSQAGTRRPEGRAARLLLLSDGLANEGDFTPEGLAGRARQAAAASITVSTLGVGEDFNELLMTDIAQAGLGNYYFLPSAEQIAPVLASELEATRETVAEEVEIALLTEPGVVVREVAGYPFATHGSRVVFHPGALFAGQERRIWITLETPATRTAALDLLRVRASFTSDGGRRSVATGAPLQVAAVAREEEVVAAIDRDAWGRGVVEDAYGRLQQEVATAVRAGRRDEAMDKIQAYEHRYTAANARVQSQAVTHNLSQLDAMEAQVEDAFTGFGQEAKQRSLAKSRQATGYDAQRAGAKRSAPPAAPPAPSASSTPRAQGGVQ